MHTPEQAHDANSYELFKQLKSVIAQNPLHTEQSLINKWAESLAVDPLICAAALLNLQQKTAVTVTSKLNEGARNRKQSQFRLVRYRLDVGIQHQVSPEQLKSLLVQESGVEHARIGRMDMRDTHTLVDLPEGMPADIFQILYEATLADRKLAIKRVKPNRRFKPKDRQ